MLKKKRTAGICQFNKGRALKIDVIAL